jgi:hypothetical protein
MVMYKCARCGKDFNKKDHYIKHSKNKSICKDLLNNIFPTEDNYIIVDMTFDCEYCDKKFTNKYSLERHKSTCSNKSNNHNNVNAETVILNNSVLNNAETINNNTNNINNNTTNNINNININDFKKTNFDYISDETLYSYLKKCMEAYPSLLKDAHFNPDHPENHNMYISNKKAKEAKYKEDGKWFIKDSGEFIEDIMTDYHNKAFLKFEGGEADKEFQKYLKITEEPEAKKKIKKRIFEMMVNEKNMVMDTEKLEKEQNKKS